MLSKKLSALVAISVLTASSAAVAQTAQPLSLAPIMRAAALGLIVWGVIELTSDDDGPSSP